MSSNKHMPSLKTAIVQPGMFRKGPFSLEVPGCKRVDGETIPRRNAKYVDKLLSVPEEGVNTLFDILILVRERFSDADGVGWRTLIQTHNEVKRVEKIVAGKKTTVEKTWTFFEMGDFKYLSFRQYVDLTMQLGAGLRHLGLQSNDRLHIFASTSPHWLAMSHAAVTQAMPIVTSYATLGEEGLETSLLQTGAKAIFVDPDLIVDLLNPLKKAPAIKSIIINNNGSAVNTADLEALKAVRSDVLVINYDDFLRIGQENPCKPVPPRPDDLCCIMYTSGTTGPPKGVPLTHKNLVAAVAGLDSIFGEFVGPGDAVLAYLPLAHSFEFAFENMSLYWGLKIGYGSPRTLSDSSMKNCSGDIKTFKPTVLIGVPAIWETIRKGIEQKLAKENALTRFIFAIALFLKAFLCARDWPGPNLLDALVFNSVKEQTGGRLRACFNGAGPLGKDTRRFISFAIVPLVSGYGLTETTAMGALQDPLQWTDDSLGDIPGCIEIKLVDFPEAGYFATNNPPQGEILIRGDPVMSGYYRNDEETAQAMAPGGWFRSGDIGEWAPNGHLKIIDRKKNLIKTLNGEYIALEKLESIYRSNSLISNICVYAADDRARPIAIAIPAQPALTSLVQKLDMPAESFEKLVHMSRINSLVLKELQDTGRKAGLAHFEIIEGLVLTDAEWTPQNGCLTPAQKLNRRKVISMYHNEIDKAYGRTKSLL